MNCNKHIATISRSSIGTILTRAGPILPATIRYDPHGSHGSNGEVSLVKVRMVLTVRFHKSRFALFSRFGFTSRDSHGSHGSVSRFGYLQFLCVLSMWLCIRQCLCYRARASVDPPFEILPTTTMPLLCGKLSLQAAKHDEENR